MQELSENSYNLSDKTITIEGINVNNNIYEYLLNILKNGKINTLQFNHIPITNDFFNTILDLHINSYVKTLAINNSNLNPNDGIELLDILDPYGPFINIDLNNNQLGGNGYQKFLTYLKDSLTEKLTGFKSLNLSNNGFQTKDIDEFKNGLDTCDLNIVTF